MKNIGRPFLLILIAVLCLPLGTMGQSKAVEALERGRKALSKGNYVAAQVEFEQCVRLNPTTPYVYSFLAKAYYYQSQYNKAINSFNNALQKDYKTRSSGEIALIYKNEVSLNLEEQNNFQPAVMYYQRARVHHLKGNSSLAIADLEKALTIDDDYEEAKVYLDHVRRRKGPLLIEAPITYNELNSAGEEVEKRPKSTFEDAPSPSMSSEEIRKARNVYFKVKKPRGRAEKKYLEKRDRRKYFEGIRVSTPIKVGYASQDYIKIETIQLYDDKTRVVFRVTNPGPDSAFLLRLDEDLKITARDADRLQTFPMIQIDNFSPNGTKLPRSGSIRFTVLFPAIPREMNYINIIEGRRNDGQQWNFYDIDLTN
ncbi:MAG: hypothetical protein AAFY71_03860 [Bacteroidota bacterium]